MYHGLELQIAETPRNNKLMVPFVDDATFCTDPKYFRAQCLVLYGILIVEDNIVL